MAELKELFRKAATFGFNTHCANVIPHSADDQKLVCKFKVVQELCNSKDTLHGGFFALTTDFITTYDLLRRGRNNHVSLDIHVSYLAAGKMNSIVRVESEVHKLGRKMAFTSTTFYDDITDKVLAQGKHTKYMLE